MAIKVDRINGQNYAENIVDSLLLFNSGTWTIPSGTGTTSLDTLNPYVGDSSLKLENNVPSTALTASNSSQSTPATTDGKFQISWYAYKDMPLEVLSADVLIYKNDVLLDTQDFSIGNTDSDLDENEVWVRFTSTNEYDLKTGEILTFQFRLNSLTTTSLTSGIWFDGVMVNLGSRLNAMPPYYTKPEGLTVQSFGTYDYQDTATATTPIVVVADTWTDLTNNALGANTSNNGFADIDIYNPLTGLFDFSGLEIGDIVRIRLDVYPVLATNNNVVDLELLAGIGGTQFSTPFVSDKYYKTSGTKRITRYNAIEIKSESTRINPAKFRIKCDAAATCIVNGWLVEVSKKYI